MPRFDEFIARHGEAAAQAIIESMERVESAPTDKLLSLEERWQRLVRNDTDQNRAA